MDYLLNNLLEYRIEKVEDYVLNLIINGLPSKQLMSSRK